MLDTPKIIVRKYRSRRSGICLSKIRPSLDGTESAVFWRSQYWSETESGLPRTEPIMSIENPTLPATAGLVHFRHFRSLLTIEVEVEVEDPALDGIRL